MSSLFNPLASDGTAASLEPGKGPFSLKDEASYAAWRSAKLAAYPKDASELRVTVRDLGSPHALGTRSAARPLRQGQHGAL